MKNSVKKIFEWHVGSIGQVVKTTFELDKNITRVTGLLLTSDSEEQLYYRGSQQIEINNVELFPENYASRLLMTGLNVPLRDKYYPLSIGETGNRQIKVTYKDKADIRVSFAPYVVYLYIDYETD